jgi:phenylacetate-CoA ligase
MMIIRGVNVYPSQIEALLIGLPEISPHYQIVLTREGALDSMTVEIEVTPGAAHDDVQKCADISGRIKSRLGVSCTIALKAPGELPRSQGKAVRVKDLRKKP